MDFDWSKFVDTSAGVLNNYIDQYGQYKTAEMKMQALGEMGYYQEGQRNQVQQQVGGLGISGGTILLVGVALVAVLLLKD